MKTVLRIIPGVLQTPKAPWSPVAYGRKHGVLRKGYWLLAAHSDRNVGWSRAWKICFRARLHDGEGAARVVRTTLEYVPANARGSGTHPNLFGAGPPFQMDANFGYTAGVAEMLLQSHLRDEQGQWLIHLLPALPTSWKDGEVTGLRARGGVTADITWKDGKVTSYRLRAQQPKQLTVRVNGQVKVVSVTERAQQFIP